jgi:hypothetical protein
MVIEIRLQKLFLKDFGDMILKNYEIKYNGLGGDR